MGRGEDERRAIHYAVLDRSAVMTRLLMRYGAEARAGVHPHRDATTAVTLARSAGAGEPPRAPARVGLSGYCAASAKSYGPSIWISRRHSVARHSSPCAALPGWYQWLPGPRA
jgi:hypothetical protein